MRRSADPNRLSMANLVFLMGCPSLADGYDGGSAEQRVRFNQRFGLTA